MRFEKQIKLQSFFEEKIRIVFLILIGRPLPNCVLRSLPVFLHFFTKKKARINGTPPPFLPIPAHFVCFFGPLRFPGFFLSG